MFLDTLYKSLTFGDFFITASPWIQKRSIKRIRKRQEQALRDVRQKERISVVFFLQTSSIWKYDKLYWKLKHSDRYEPHVVVSPYNVHLYYDKQECLKVMEKTFAFALEQGYDATCAYDFENKRWRNIRKMLNPDVVFFSKPYKDTLPQYHLYRFKDKLSLYTPYGFLCIDIYRISYNLPFHNLLWKFLVETKFQQEFSEQYSLCKGDNTLVVGAIGSEQLVDPHYHPTDVWKPQDRPKKRVIWAPHHTVDYLFNFSNFLNYCEPMLELAEKYQDQIQFAFKPHPVLKFKLINLWGKEKTEQYYRRWAEMPNTQLEEGYYNDLFLGSDALIHDCASFTAEYLFTRKPVLFMVRDPEVEKHWNPFGKRCFEQHYHAESIEAVERFLTDTVLDGNDPMREDREAFFHQYLFDGTLPSERIYQFLNETLSKQS